MTNPAAPSPGASSNRSLQDTVCQDPTEPKPTSLGDQSVTLIGDNVSDDKGEAAVGEGGKIGKYQIRAKLGSGGMGAVYLAFDPMIEREVALKVLSPELGSSPTALQRFLGEARAIGRLNNPHVVSIYDIDQWNERYFIVMELLSGGSVADRIDDAGPLNWQEACRWTAEAARGLAAAHSAGMVHRDIKPENLMLTKELAVKVVDFGLSKLLDASQDPQNAVTKAGQIMGTPQYMSPEQFESSNVDFRTDIYSLGATLFRLLTGRFPYQDSQTIMQVMTSHLTKPPPKPTEHLPGIPDDLNLIVACAMAKSPSDRYQSMDEFAAVLDQLRRRSRSSAESSLADWADRHLVTAVVLEPSRLQEAIWKDALGKAGVTSVSSADRMLVAKDLVAANPPDLIVTAMELPDGQGIDLLRSLGASPQFQRMTAVLNSSDCTLDDLKSIGDAPCLILAPKKARPAQVLRVIHAASPCRITMDSCDPSSLRLCIRAGGETIPDALASVIRNVGVLDIEVQPADVSTPSSAELTLILTPLSSSRRWEGSGMGATLTVEHDQLVLREVNWHGIAALCHSRLDADRLFRLLQTCRL